VPAEERPVAEAPGELAPRTSDEAQVAHFGSAAAVAPETAGNGNASDSDQPATGPSVVAPEPSPVPVSEPPTAPVPGAVQPPVPARESAPAPARESAPAPAPEPSTAAVPQDAIPAEDEERTRGRSDLHRPDFANGGKVRDQPGTVGERIGGPAAE
jgi:hypothetical protein